jgi:tRNA (guanine-N7-)-methyltransferase
VSSVVPVGVQEALAVVAARAPGLRLEVEIGCGNGHFLTEYARDLADTMVIGVDAKPLRCEKAAGKASRLGLDRVVIVCARAEQLLDALPQASVDAFHVYFPDPWPKTRHRKRRFMRREQLEILHTLLAPGGRLYFATDFFDYYLQTKLLLLAHGGFALEDSAPPPQAFVSVFSLRFADWGRPLHALVGRKGASGASGAPGA